MTEITLLELPSVQDWWLSLNDFMTQGGPVLWGLALVAALSWLLVFERLLFLITTFPSLKKQTIAKWQLREDKASWVSQSMRESWLFEARTQLYRNLNFLKALVAICPMLGLLGTVTGMISVFDLMALEGTGEPRSMAAGISLATLPTMAGMVIALAGLFAHARLQKTCERREASLTQALRSQA
ncbi:MotA/TolQ/ExbB proton channel family protein [Grimontia kaedaensis]|uniref:MotA/TolQ/ExbB proton channel family protein n=1 Tax=Grimontia kaedaensis TaxID=2872157 RepID=A0ABY4X0E7_9GAMM|nr:MotA/TolQ/ExbB proton channel family protein [Grimontia kaedaensis]USH04702.1 MotA/TolQ/ExbB proton channel family protein [Grimontia kaedaensis]